MLIILKEVLELIDKPVYDSVSLGFQKNWHSIIFLLDQ